MSFLRNLAIGLGGGLAGFGLGTRGGRRFLFGQKGKPMRFDTFSPEQKSFQDQIIQGLSQAGPEALNRLTQLLSGDDEAFSAFEAPYLRRFEREIAPGIAERFAGMGSHGALSSGGLNQALSQAGRDLSTDLAALRGGLQQNALGQLQGYSTLGLSPRFQTAYRPPTGGLFGGMAQGVGQGAAQYGIPALMGLMG
jgi:hypothetical protein